MIEGLTIKKARAALDNKEFSAVELAEAYNKKCADENGEINAFITLTPEHALKQAAEADEAIKNGNAKLLTGVPIAVKDLFCTEGVRTTAASKILENFVPEYESKISANLFNAGAVMPGKTNLDEFAMGSANITSYYGNVLNPLDKTRVPGGSSGGSAAAVAANQCLGSLGTDTGGSIRQPAAFTGTVGIKPTYGRCSRWGTVAFASSLDQAGVFAKNVEDSAILMESIAGYDANDSTSVEKEVPNWAANINSDIKGKRIGIPKEYDVEGMPESAKKFWEQGAAELKAQGAQIVEISLPHTKYALPTYYVIAPAEASSNLSRYDGVRFGYRTDKPFNSLDEMYELTRAEGFGDEVKRRILIGTYVLSHGYYDAYYLKAQRVRNKILQDFNDAFEKVDVILTPTTPSGAFKFGENEDDPVKMYLNDVLTVPASLAGLPAASVPFGKDENNMPLGLQLIAPAWQEQELFNIGSALEKANS